MAVIPNPSAPAGWGIDEATGHFAPLLGTAPAPAPAPAPTPVPAPVASVPAPGLPGGPDPAMVVTGPSSPSTQPTQPYLQTGQTAPSPKGTGMYVGQPDGSVALVTPSSDVNPSDPLSTPTSFSDFVKAYQDAYDQLGLGGIKTSFNETQKSFTDLQDELNSKISDINENPWLTEGQRREKIAGLQDRYERRLTNLTGKLQLYQSLGDRGRQEAQFITSHYFDTQAAQNRLLAQQAAADQAFRQNVLLRTMDIAGRQQEALQQYAFGNQEFKNKQTYDLMLKTAEAGGNPLLIDPAKSYQENVAAVGNDLAKAKTQEAFIRNIQVALGIANATGDPSIVTKLLGQVPNGTLPASPQSPQGYVQTVAGALHVTPDMPLSAFQGRETELASAMQIAEGYSPGTVSYRNNNPGNLVANGTNYPGMVGTQRVTDPNGTTRNFVTFGSYASGFQAMVKDLAGKIRGNTTTGLGPTSTLNDLVNTWVNGISQPGGPHQPIRSGSPVVDSWVDSIMNGTRMTKEVPDKLWPQVQLQLNANGFTPQMGIDAEAKKKFDEQQGKILTKDEANAAGLPLGSTWADAAGKYALNDSQRTALGTFSLSFSMLDQIAKYSAKLNTESNYASAISKGLQLSIDARTRKNPDAALLLSKSAELVQIIRALGEKGNIPQQQVERAINLVPGFFDTSTVAQGKLNDLKSLFNDGFKSTLSSATTAVSGQDIQNIRSGNVTAQQFFGGTKDNVIEGGVKIKVRRKSDGKIGLLSPGDFNASTYEKL